MRAAAFILASFIATQALSDPSSFSPFRAVAGRGDGQSNGLSLDFKTTHQLNAIASEQIGQQLSQSFGSRTKFASELGGVRIEPSQQQDVWNIAIDATKADIELLRSPNVFTNKQQFFTVKITAHSAAKLYGKFKTDRRVTRNEDGSVIFSKELNGSSLSDQNISIKCDTVNTPVFRVFTKSSYQCNIGFQLTMEAPDQPKRETPSANPSVTKEVEFNAHH
jgi:hypothetical protein